MNMIKFGVYGVLDGVPSNANEPPSRVLAVYREKCLTVEEIHASAFASSDITMPLTLVRESLQSTLF